MRNLFRSTEYHNTMVVDAEESNTFDEHLFFAIGLDATSRCFCGNQPEIMIIIFK